MSYSLHRILWMLPESHPRHFDRWFSMPSWREILGNLLNPYRLCRLDSPNPAKIKCIAKVNRTTFSSSSKSRQFLDDIIMIMFAKKIRVPPCPTLTLFPFLHVNRYITGCLLAQQSGDIYVGMIDNQHGFWSLEEFWVILKGWHFRTCPRICSSIPKHNRLYYFFVLHSGHTFYSICWAVQRNVNTLKTIISIVWLLDHIKSVCKKSVK